MYKLMETMTPQKLFETAAQSPTKNVGDSIAGVIKTQTESSTNHGYFDMWEPELREAFQNLGEGQAENFLANVARIPFRDFFDRKNSRIKEYLASSGTTGIAGAYYLIPVKLYTTLQVGVVTADVVSQISQTVLGPDELGSGTTCNIDIMKDGSYKPIQTSPGSTAHTETMETLQAKLDFTPVWTINFRLANDLLEDSQFPLLELHLQEAGRRMGEKASDMAITIAYTAPDGDGTAPTLITSTTGDTSKWLDAGVTGLSSAYDSVTQNGFTPDTLIITTHAMGHSVMGYSGIVGNDSAIYNEFLHGGLPKSLAGMNVVYSNTDYLSNNQAYTDCKAVVMARQYGIVTGRKRWMRIENYSEPVRDLKGAVVSFRQDSVSLFKDAMCRFTEV
jgi:hypothetical protein